MTACGSCPWLSHTTSRALSPPMPPASFTMAIPISAPSRKTLESSDSDPICDSTNPTLNSGSAPLGVHVAASAAVASPVTKKRVVFISPSLNVEIYRCRPTLPRKLLAAPEPCEGSGRLHVLTIAYAKGGQQHEAQRNPHLDDSRRQPAAAQGSNRALSAGRARQHLAAASQIRSHGDCLAAGRRWHRHRGRRRVRQGNAQIRGLYGAWWSYIYDRLSGYEISQAQAARGRQGWTFGSRERAEFAEFYAEDGGMGSAGQTGGSSTSRLFGLVCTGPVKYSGHARVRRDIDNLKD